MLRANRRQKPQDGADPRAENIALAKRAIIGAAYRKPIELVEKFANEDFSVLLVGETGAGKELFARLFFACSPREKVKKNDKLCCLSGHPSAIRGLWPCQRIVHRGN